MANSDKKLEEIEPSAEIREASRQMAQIYAGLRLEGFSEQQALYIVAQGIRPDNGAPGEGP